jgi:PAS domain-containing protein
MNPMSRTRLTSPRWCSLQLRLLVPLAAGCLAMVLLSFAASSALARSQGLAQLHHRALGMARMINYAAETTPSRTALQRLVSAMGGEPDVNDIAIVVGPAHRVIAATHNGWVGRPLGELADELTDAQITAALTQRTEQVVDHRDQSAVSVVAPLLLSHAGTLEGGAVLVRLNAAGVEQQIAATVLTVGSASVALSLAVWGGVALLVQRVVLRPIAAIDRAVHQGVDAPVPVRCDDEIGQMARTLNASRQQLHASREELRRLAMVAERTSNAVVITDAAGHIVWVNAGFSRLTGYTLEEVVGRRPGGFLQCEASDPVAVAPCAAPWPANCPAAWRSSTAASTAGRTPWRSRSSRSSTRSRSYRASWRSRPTSPPASRPRPRCRQRSKPPTPRPSQEQVPRQHEPRDPHADDGVLGFADLLAEETVTDPRRAGREFTCAPSAQRRAPAGDHQRHPRPLQDRGRRR